MKVWAWIALGMAATCSTAGLQAQSELQLVSKNFHFEEGIFLSHTSFRTNSPDLSWEEVEVSSFTNPQTFITQIEYVRLKEGGKAISPDSIWAVSIEGIPYVRLSRDWILKELATFAPLKLRGKICYFEFTRKDTVQVLIKVYNPVNGLPFREALVDREEEVRAPMILEFESGRIAEFNRQNLLAWIQDDALLTEAVLELPEEELEAKLFRSLLIYVDRNKVYIP
jgi:hypothetical protein